ncbi:MAG: hypothetical protein AB9819_01955 [Methanomassiliicoccales archaeon]
MKIELIIRHKCDGEGGHVIARKVNDSGSKDIGEMLFRDEKEKNWILAVLMERHPHVTLLQDGVPCDDSKQTGGTPC